MKPYRFTVKSPIVVCLKTDNISNGILDFSAGITDRDLYEFQDIVDKMGIKYVLFVVMHADAHYTIKEGDQIEVVMDINKPNLVWKGKYWLYAANVLIMQRLTKDDPITP